MTDPNKDQVELLLRYYSTWNNGKGLCVTPRVGYYLRKLGFTDGYFVSGPIPTPKRVEMINSTLSSYITHVSLVCTLLVVVGLLLASRK